MTLLTARNGLRTNTAESIAELTGGEFRRFHDAKDLKTGLFAVSNGERVGGAGQGAHPRPSGNAIGP